MNDYPINFEYDVSCRGQTPAYKAYFVQSSVQMHGLIPFYITWDLDGFYQERVSTDRNEDDRYNRKLMLGTRKTASFVWHLPSYLIQYMNSGVIKKQPWVQTI